MYTLTTYIINQEGFIKEAYENTFFYYHNVAVRGTSCTSVIQRFTRDKAKHFDVLMVKVFVCFTALTIKVHRLFNFSHYSS